MRLIDVDALNFDGLGICEVMEALMEAPSIEPKRGEWICKPQEVFAGVGEVEIEDWYLCSACNYGLVSDAMPYCPNCGCCMSDADIGSEGAG